MPWPTKKLGERIIFSENVIAYVLYKNYISKESKVFFKVSHNIKPERDWYYCCSPDVDVIEIRKDEIITAYELKGMRKGRKRKMFERMSPDYPSFYEGIGQAVAYLNLPYVGSSTAPKNSEEDFDRFGAGAFDLVYLIYPRDKIENFPAYEKRIFDLLPIGVIFAIPDGKFGIVKKAPQNPLQSKEAKKHFLSNLESLEKFSVNSKIFRKIREKGEQYFSIYET